MFPQLDSDLKEKVSSGCMTDFDADELRTQLKHEQVKLIRIKPAAFPCH